MMIDGSEVSGVVRAEVQSNSHLAGDRFRLQIARTAAPGVARLGPDQTISLSFGVNGAWREVLVGQADSVSLDPVIGLFAVEGRDLSARLVDAQTAETFLNRTSSEIVSILAGRHGIDAAIDRTSTPVGRYYQSEHDRLALGQLAKVTTEWDLIAYLATQERFDLFMDGPTLHFSAPSQATPVQILTSDCTNIHLHHRVNLSRPLDVMVQSWSSRTATTTSVTSRAAGTGATSVRFIARPNLTADEAQRLADRVILDTKRHEWTAEISMPGELHLTSRSQVRMSGTSTGWDRDYVVVRLTRSIDQRRGFVQSLSLQGRA